MKIEPKHVFWGVVILAALSAIAVKGAACGSCRERWKKLKGFVTGKKEEPETEEKPQTPDCNDSFRSGRDLVEIGCWSSSDG